MKTTINITKETVELIDVTKFSMPSTIIIKEIEKKEINPFENKKGLYFELTGEFTVNDILWIGRMQERACTK